MKISKTILIAVIAASISQVAQAAFKTNDLYFGLTQSGAQNDYIIDLGQPGVIGVGGSASVTLDSDFSLATFNSVFTGGPDGVAAAVVAGDNTFGRFGVWATQLRVGGAGNPAVASSSVTATHSSSQMSGGAGAITGVAAAVGGLPSAGNSVLDPDKTYSSAIDLATSGNNFIAKTGVNPTGTFDGTGILYMDLYHATTTSNYTYVGYFKMDVVGGHLTFTPSGAPGTSGPPQPTLSFVKSGSTNLISFLSANSATYTLYFTNSAGLTTPVSNWPTAGTLIGDGTTETFTNSPTDSSRFYRVGAH